jgi:hypothetical protein
MVWAVVGRLFNFWSELEQTRRSGGRWTVRFYEQAVRFVERVNLPGC